MFCIKCGRPLEDEANFCPVCGARRVAAEPSQGSTAELRAKKSARAKPALIIIAAALLLTAAVLLFSFPRSQTAKGESLPSQPASPEIAAPESPALSAAVSETPSATPRNHIEEAIKKAQQPDKSVAEHAPTIQALIDKYSPASTSTPAPVPKADSGHSSLDALIEQYFPSEADHSSSSSSTSDSFYSSCSQCGGSGDCRMCGGKGGKNKWTGDSYVWQSCAFCSNGSCPYC